MFATHIRRNHATGHIDIFIRPAGHGTEEELLEGGFFSWAHAENARKQWEQELLNDMVEKAERKAGWDPNP